jgi:glucokinase
MILVGDIGGTKTHLALFKDRKMVRDQKFPSREFPSLSAVVQQFLSSHSEQIEKACFGVAGPVVNGACHATNLPWVIEAKKIAEEFQIKQVSLINDLEANAWGIRALSPKELIVIQEGVAHPGNQALISAGTGLGEAGLFWDGKQHYPFASEGGHTDFGPRDELEMELLRYLRKQYPHVSYERILSGAGIYQLYRFLIDMRLEKEGSEFEQIALSDTPARVITEKALSKESKVCVRTLEWFLSIYGAEAGNVALKFLPTGGLYIGGGIAAKLGTAFQSGAFMKGFLAKGRFEPLLTTIPVHLILNENTALLGAAEFTNT